MAQQLKTDWILFLTVLTLVCFGLVMVYSASSFIAELKYHVPSTFFFFRQLGWAVVSFLILLYCMRRDYREWNNPKVAFASLGIVVLLLVAVYITDSGSHRWLRAGPLSLQPSELAKPALALFLAFFLCRRLGSVNERHTLRSHRSFYFGNGGGGGHCRFRHSGGAGGDYRGGGLRRGQWSTAILRFARGWAFCWGLDLS